MYIAKQKHFHRYRKQTSGYQWEDGRGMWQDMVMQLRDTNYYV